MAEHKAAEGKSACCCLSGPFSFRARRQSCRASSGSHGEPGWPACAAVSCQISCPALQGQPCQSYARHQWTIRCESYMSTSFLCTHSLAGQASDKMLRM